MFAFELLLVSAQTRRLRNTAEFIYIHGSPAFPTSTVEYHLTFQRCSFAEQIADWTFTIEDVNLREICMRANLPSCPSEEEGHAMVSACYCFAGLGC